MALSGSYVLVKADGVLEHMTADGLPKEFAEKAAAGGQKLEISVSGDKLTITRGSDPRGEQVLSLSQETEQKGPDGKTIKNKASLNGNVLTVETQSDRGSSKRVYSLSGSELTLTMSSSKPGVPEAKRIYKKE